MSSVLDYLYSELTRVKRQIQSTKDLKRYETDRERRYRYQVTLDGLYREKQDLEARIQQVKEETRRQRGQY